MSARERRGVLPGAAARIWGSAPSRARAAPIRLPPAKYTLMAPVVSSTATTVVTGRACSPNPSTSRSDSGAGPGAGPSTATVANATPRYSVPTTATAIAVARGMSRDGRRYSAASDPRISHPANAQTSSAAADPTAPQPCGTNGVRWAGSACGSATTTATPSSSATDPAMTSCAVPDTRRSNQFTTAHTAMIATVVADAAP